MPSHRQQLSEETANWELCAKTYHHREMKAAKIQAAPNGAARWSPPGGSWQSGYAGNFPGGIGSLLGRGFDVCLSHFHNLLDRSLCRLNGIPVSYTHLRAHETRHDPVCR